MKGKKLFLWLLLLLFLLIGLFVFLVFNERYIASERCNTKPIESIPLVKTLKEGQQDINQLLQEHAFSFVPDGAFFSNNQENNQTLSMLMETLKNLGGSFALIVAVHTNQEKRERFNRKLSQERADMIATYIKQHYHATYINAIGYGEEFPLLDENNKTKSSERVEIYLQQIISKN